MNRHHGVVNHWPVAAWGAGILILIFGGGKTAALAQTPHPLSPSALQNAERQIHALTLDKAHWTKAQQKLDTQLVFGARMKATGVIHPAAPKLQPSLKAEVDGRIKVDIKGTVTPALRAAIQAAGGTIICSLPGYHTIQALLPVENIEALAARDEVRFIRPAQKPNFNDVDSEGDYTHEAIDARADYPCNGTGITVGVLSDSIDNGSNALADAIEGGNIDPNNTFVIPGQAGTGEGEGLAMCEIVHDLAPQAKIWFATAYPGDAQMASNIIALAQAGCRIIADDISFPDESPFQDGVIAQAVDTVTSMGVLYFSCARNSGNADAGTSSTWEGNFVLARDTLYGEELEFGTGEFAAPYDEILTGGSDFEADLFWADPLGASTNDYDLYMLNSEGNIVYSSINWQNGTQDPYEYIADSAQVSDGYYLAVTLYSGTTNRFLYLDFGRGVLDWYTAGCIRGHNACDASNSFTVAATPAYTAYSGSYYAGVDDSGTGTTGPYPDPFNSSDIVEYFSSDGPRRMFYYPDGTPITPGVFNSTGGKVYYKPDLTAADGVETTVPGGFQPFFGTSCATPHAAAIAAMVWSYNRSLTPAQVGNILTNSCIDIMATGWDRDSGYGILMALTALENTPAPSFTPPSFVPGSMSYSSVGQFQGALAGTVGYDYYIEASTNLLNWTNLGKITMTNTSSIFTVSNINTHLSGCFYRGQFAY